MFWAKPGRNRNSQPLDMQLLLDIPIRIQWKTFRALKQLRKTHANPYFGSYAGIMPPLEVSELVATASKVKSSHMLSLKRNLQCCTDCARAACLRNWALLGPFGPWAQSMGFIWALLRPFGPRWAYLNKYSNDDINLYLTDDIYGQQHTNSI